jgi:O-antigen ligase
MKYTDYLRWGAILAVFAALFIPFIVASGGWGMPNLFFPYITGKNFIFRFLVEFALLCYVLLALREPKYRPRASHLMWAALAFVVWMALATMTSVDPIKSFWSNFERMEGYVGLLHLFVWFVITGALLSAENLWERFFNVSIGVAAVQGGWALFQFLGWLSISSQSGARADTTFGNATYTAVYLLINIFLALFMLARTRDSRNKVALQTLYIAAIVLQSIGVLLTETRGAILGVVAGLLVAAVYLLLFSKGKESQALRRYALGAIVLVVVVGGALFAARDTAFVQNTPALGRIASISLSETTVASRLDYIWPMALKGAADKPLFGWGQENFSFVFNKYYEPPMYNQEQWFDRAHNQFLDWLIAGGVPAFLLYLSLYVLAAWAIFRSPKFSLGERAALMGFLAAYAFNNLFVFDNLVSAMYFFCLLAFIHSVSRRELPGSVALSKPVGDQTLAIIAPIVLGLILFGSWSLNAPGLARASVLVSALQTEQAGLNSAGATVGVPRDPKGNLADFQTSLGAGIWPGNPLGRQEATEQLLQFVSNLAPQSSVDPQVKSDAFVAAKSAIDALIAGRQGDARLELFDATLLAQFGQTADALTHLQNALKYSPQKQQILIQLGLTDLQIGDIQGALSALKQAFESEKSYDGARNYYAAALYYAGQSAQADALLTERYGTTVVDDPQLLQAYMSLKLYNRAIAVWQKRLAAAPNDVQTNLGLASVYFASGDKINTIALLQKIAKLEPSAALQMQNLIKQIEDGTLKPQ